MRLGVPNWIVDFYMYPIPTMISRRWSQFWSHFDLFLIKITQFRLNSTNFWLKDQLKDPKSQLKDQKYWLKDLNCQFLSKSQFIWRCLIIFDIFLIKINRFRTSGYFFKLLESISSWRFEFGQQIQIKKSISNEIWPKID